jgi:predicted regulator of Ras-like GTPase activity (Roadblock/LC7/MglB family)
MPDNAMGEKVVRAFLGAIPSILLITCIVAVFAAALGCASRVYQKIENKPLTPIN